MKTIAKAAGGDVQSLRQMASYSHEAAFERQDLTGLVCLAEALTFSRLASALGCDTARGNAFTILHDMAERLSDLGDFTQAEVFAAQAEVMERELN